MNRFLTVLVGISTLVGISSATLITFDDGQTNGAAVGAYYSSFGVVFTNAMWSNNFGYSGGSGSQGIASLSSEYQPQQSDPIGATFSSPVSSVTLRGLDVAEQGYRLKAFDASDNLIDNQFVVGNFLDGQPYDLTVNGSIKRIEFSQDNAGIGIDGVVFDNLSFTANPVPEPASLLVLGVGAALLKRRCRRR